MQNGKLKTKKASERELRPQHHSHVSYASFYQILEIVTVLTPFTHKYNASLVNCKFATLAHDCGRIEGRMPASPLQSLRNTSMAC